MTTSQKSVARKGHIKPGARIALLHPVKAVVASLGLEDPVITKDPSSADLVFVFAASHAELKARMPSAMKSLGPRAHLWVFFKKGAAAAGLDMNRDDVWAVAEKGGLRPVSLLSVDDVWSAFRFRRA